MSAIERARADEARGDLGLARRRLASYLVTKGYDGAVLAELGRIANAMHDLAAAGLYWVASPATGPDVDAAVDALRRECGGSATELARRLPAFARLPSLADYAPAARARLEALGYDPSQFRPRPAPTRVAASIPKPARAPLLVTGIAAIGLLTLGLWVVGLVTVLEWVGALPR